MMSGGEQLNHDADGGHLVLSKVKNQLPRERS